METKTQSDTGIIKVQVDASDSSSSLNIEIKETSFASDSGDDIKEEVDSR